MVLLLSCGTRFENFWTREHLGCREEDASSVLGRVSGSVMLAATTSCLLTFPSWLQEAPQLEVVWPLISDPLSHVFSGM